MASKSRAAQEKLAELEKNSAPFEDQLLEAAKFIGLNLEDAGRLAIQTLEPAGKCRAAVYHGREEWLLRWLLKRLQNHKDGATRKAPNSWILFCHLIRVIPLPNVARMLNERKFMTILRLTLEEIQSAITNGGVTKNTSDVSSGSEGEPAKISKKRKRSGELISTSNYSGNHIQRLSAYVFAAIHQMLRLSNVVSDITDSGRATAFSTEYMRSVIRTPTEDAAKILGAWLSLSHISLQDRETLDIANIKSWLSTFIEIWDCRSVGNDDFLQFSFHCSQPLLSLFKVMKTGKATPENWMDEMEQLVARNVIIPARAAILADVDSDLLKTLTRISVLQLSANAPILFEVAIRSIRAQVARLRRPSDEAWLQTVFTTLKDAMPPTRAEANGKAIREMLESAIKYKVVLQLSTLRFITSEFCFVQSSTNWELLATIINLDANVFLIQHDDKDLALQVLTRITAASLDPMWSNLHVQVVAEVLVPLMRSFAKARDLTTFIHYWYSELVQFEKLQNGATALNSAWEGEIIQIEFSKIMEASLTVAQIIQLLHWLSSQVVENPNAVCVILQAVAGAISQEDFTDAVGLRLFHIIFKGSASKNLDGRYRWRSWRIFSDTLRWATQIGLDEVSALWEEDAVPFQLLSSKFEDGSFFDVDSDKTVNYERLEILRCACRVVGASRKGTRLHSLARKPVLDFLYLLSRDIKLLPQELVCNKEPAGKKGDLTLNTICRGIPWMLWASVSCIFHEFSTVLELGTEMEGNAFRPLLEMIFWIASVPEDSTAAPPSSMPWSNPVSFPNAWTSLLNDDGVLRNPVLVSLIIDLMISNASNDANPLVKSPTTNTFAVKCLLDLPIEIFSKKDRERVMKNWLPSSEIVSGELSGHYAALDPAVLSLKVKVMQRFTVHEGSKYQDLISLADALASAKIKNVDVSLLYFKELVQRIMTHITTNLDQHRNRKYVSDALNHLRDTLKTQTSKKHANKLDFALIALFEALFEVFTARTTQLNDLGIIARSECSSLEESFQTCLLSQLEKLLTKVRKSSKSGRQADRILMARSAVGALAKLNVNKGKTVNPVVEAEVLTASLDGIDTEFARRLETLISTYSLSADADSAELQLDGNISTVYGRQALADRTHEFVKRKDQRQKLALLQSSLQERWSWTQLDKLWAVRQIIISCEDSQQALEKEDIATIDLSTVYSLYCSHLWQTISFRQFSLISETMAMMLRTKSRAMNQWNIDNTLGDITIMCSRKAPLLRPARAGSIYTHLCQLLQTLFTSHRLKLEGHFHLVVQAMQSLLRCLFMPLRQSTSKTSKFFAQPPWLSSPKHQLNAKHAAAFTRLVTLICDPSVSSVTRSKHNNLTSATDKAKRMAGQHMQYVLTLYVQLQLEMKMLPEVRDKMAPGLYAMFDTTTPEMRRMIGDGLDSSGRAVFGMLFKDYQKFGKWKGS